MAMPSMAYPMAYHPAMVNRPQVAAVGPSGGGHAADMAIKTQLQTWPASMVNEAVRWHGIDVAAVSIRYHGLDERMLPRVAAPFQPRSSIALSSDSSDVELEIPDEFDPIQAAASPGYLCGQCNIGPVKPMQELVSDHHHNSNLVSQFEDLAREFGGWRPIRGDGNCYYRAVLFAWLERCVVLEDTDRIRAFSDKLKESKALPGMEGSVRVCQKLLKSWMRQRKRCATETQLVSLLGDIASEFEKARYDHAFILCLRHLIARYLLDHAHEPIVGSVVNNTDALTYESWARATAEEGITNLRDYCERNVLVMGTDAADLVQHVCPHVLSTYVRICMVDRQSSICTFVDYGDGAVPASSKGAVQMQVQTAAQLASQSGLGGLRPEIFLLFKPGHYEILIKQDDAVAKLVCSDLHPRVSSPQIRGRSEHASLSSTARSSESPEVLRWKRRADERWKGLMRLTNAIVDATTSVMQCLDDKLAEELDTRQKRVGNIDELLFEGTLSSIFHQLQQLLISFHRYPDDSPFFVEMKELPDSNDADAMSKMFPKLSALLQRCRPGGAPAPPQATPGLGVKLQQQPRAVPVEVQVQIENAPPAPPWSMIAASPKPDVSATLECCICLQREATAVAACGCAYHARCLLEYATDSDGQDLFCHLHDTPLDSEFIRQHIPNFARAPPAPAGPPVNAASLVSTTSATPARTPGTALRPNALSQAQTIGPTTQKELDVLAGKSPFLSQTIGPTTQREIDALATKPPYQQPSPVGLITQFKLDAAYNPKDRSGLAAWAQAQSIGQEARAQLNPIVVNDEPPPPVGLRLSPRPSRLSPRPSMYASAPAGSAYLHSAANLRRVSGSMMRVPQSGMLGAALGVPCVICFGEDGVLKTLHCGYKVHSTCLRSFWKDKVQTLCKMTDIRCPAEVAGCSVYLSELDLRDVISAAELAEAERNIQDMDAQNRTLIEEMKKQMSEYRAMFQCAICLVDHEVEGCCTLPCQHRFCFESLQYHFDIVVRERRLKQLTCPVDGCDCNLRSEECIPIFKQCLSEQTYNKLLEFLARDLQNIIECKFRGCEEKIFLEDGDDWADCWCKFEHHFCAKCENGPHRGLTCEEQQDRLDKERKQQQEQRDDDEARAAAAELGWKPCPMRCTFGGGYKAAEECDHVTCECGFEFCWDCGVDRKVLIQHDNRWHKPSCRYWTNPAEVDEAPKRSQHCPACSQQMWGRCCPFPKDDGYPGSFLRRRGAVR